MDKFRLESTLMEVTIGAGSENVNLVASASNTAQPINSKLLELKLLLK